MKIAIISVHKSYDYRIIRHIKSMIQFNWEIHYYNISNEENLLFDVKSKNVKYFHYKLLKKFSIKTIKIFVDIRKKILNHNYNYIFLQDLVLLNLVYFLPRRLTEKVVLDIHEVLGIESMLNKVNFKILITKLNKSVVMASNTDPDTLKFLEKKNKKIYILNNYPLLEDLKISKKLKFKKNLYVISYIGMITEERRQMLKTLDIFRILLESGKFKVFLVGPIANRYKNDEIKVKISKLKKYKNFFYFGPQPRNKVNEILLESDFLINLLDVPEHDDVSSNKFFEAIMSENIYISNHVKYGIDMSLTNDLVIKVFKEDNCNKIAQKILSLVENENLNYIKKKYIDLVYSNKLYWDKFLKYYQIIFK
ncbi:hypothetical protein [Marinitoga sp. 1155]|uniref:hypothetical protein n=1 Tax=Marinitoga sp. 1155 TaxID=1428448 RepID=UPI0006410FA9|nr:hypothetical protein [Marinitoga sp. 1155]KLO21945.1 hypothetical protein X274_09365 [Marinitoga sp. 1155]